MHKHQLFWGAFYPYQQLEKSQRIARASSILTVDFQFIVFIHTNDQRPCSWWIEISITPPDSLVHAERMNNSIDDHSLNYSRTPFDNGWVAYRSLLVE